MLSSPRKIALLLVVLLLFPFGCSHEPDSQLTAPTHDSFGIKSAPAGYYDTVDESSSTALRTTLHAVIDDHTKIPYTSSSTDTWNVLEAADEDPNNSSNILDVYLNASYLKQGGGNTDYNREHCWPKSYGFPNDGSSNYPYTDCHHLFLANDSYNSSRSNKPYNYCADACDEKVTEVNDGMGGGSGVYPGQSNWTSGSLTSGTWETWIGRRGDVARALFYLDVRYEGGTHGVTGYSEPDLVLTDNLALIDASNTGSNLSVAYMGMLSTLLEWHQQDPVDAREMARNDAVYSFQGNRNPFIDHPEWVECIFSGACGGTGDTTPPAAPTGLAATPGNGSVTLDWADNGETDLAGYVVYRATSSGGPYSSLNGSLLTASNYTDTAVTSGVTYYYVVSAEDTSGNESAVSGEVGATPTGGGTGGDPVAWINEFHYDNSGSDTGEFFEIAGTAGTGLDGWSVVGYNGSGGTVYNTVALSGTLADQSAGFGTLSFAMAGMQNGSPDGLALVDDGGTVVMFISYEGTISATDGPAAGSTSTDVGVSETGTTPIGHSLQLTGDGSVYADFSWSGPLAGTSGAVNTGQTFSGGAPVNLAPSAEANGPYSGGEGVAISFSSSGSADSDGSIVGWSWDFGDGSTSTAANPSHTYATAGSYTATLTVTDDLGATGSDTAPVTVNDLTPPAAPSGLTATAGDGVVDLDWADNGESDLAGYIVYRATTSGGAFTAVTGLLTGSLYSDTGVANGTTYYYVIAARDGNGNESLASSEASATPSGGVVTPGDVWINEFHYDNDGSDAGEFFEVAGTAGTSLGGWSVVGYNGNGGTAYNTVALSGTLADLSGGYGVLSFAMAGMQNGSPDGLALVDDGGSVVMFISYEGSFTANDGPAAGLTSTDIGISEPTTTPLGYSLQLTGDGTSYADFSWTGPIAATDGAVNTGQTFGGVVLDQYMHVATVTAGVNGSSKAYTTVSVVDAQGNPLAGVTVTGTFTGRARGTFSAVTDAGGVASVVNPNRFKRRYSFTFCVDDLGLTGWTYDSGANVVSCDTY